MVRLRQRELRVRDGRAEVGVRRPGGQERLPLRWPALVVVQSLVGELLEI